MEAVFDHNKLLKKIAKERLLPHGIIQQGKSRSFLYDNGWWTIIIEFQSSSFSKGTYLNIGVDFNFYPREDFAFTYGYREKGFESVKDEKQFEQLIIEYCNYAIAKVEELKKKFQDVYSAVKTFRKAGTGSGWDNFNLGVLYGISGQLSVAKSFHKKVVKEKCEYDYEFERQQLATEILTWLNDANTFLENIKSLISKTRQMKKLPLVDLDNLQERKTTHKSVLAIWRQLIGK